MKTVILLLFGAIAFTSCQKPCINQAPPNYQGLYVGSYQVHLSISNDLGFSNSVTLPDHADVAITITPDTTDNTKIWISGLFGCSQGIPATPGANGFQIISSPSGVHPSQIGFSKIGGQIDPDFDIMTISGSYTKNGALQYELSDNGFSLAGCSGTM